MPFARVGAMPQPTSNKQRNGQRKGGSNTSVRQKGITMEDLKKQTALRLAQEQQQKQGVGYVAADASPGIRDRPLQPLPGHQLSGHGQFAPPQAPNAFVNHPPGHPHYASSRGVMPAPQAGFPSPPSYRLSHHSPTNIPLNHPGGYNNYASPSRVQLFEGAENRQSSPRNMQPHAPGLRQDVDNLPRSQYTPADFVPSVAAAQPTAAADAVGTSHRTPGKGKQKLPHGLTVHELKEMTKARLQAEASEFPESETQREFSIDSRRLSPLDFDSVPEGRERAASRDSGYNNSNNMLHHGPESSNSIPSLVQVNSHSRDSAFSRQPQVSPLPVGFQNSGSAFQQHKVDAWESVSVASHNSTAVSENYGSDSVYSGGFGSGYPQPSDSDVYSQGAPFTGQERRPALEELSCHSSSAHASPSNANNLFDATIGGNRRRAMTHSPRSAAIHEDRPILHCDDLRMPSNFSSSSRGALQSRPSGDFSPVLGLGLDGSYLGQNAGLAPLGGTDLNRPRTSSATSLPLSSHGALEFNRHRANTFNGFSAGQPRADGLTDSISNALTESFLRVSQHESERSGSINSQAFGEGMLAPPGFDPNAPSTMGSAPTHVPAYPQHGAVDMTRESSFPSTWQEQTLPTGANGSSWFDAQGIDELANNMGSILKLSGVGPDRPDRERSNTYPYSSFR